MLPDLAGEGGLSTFPAVLGTMAEPSRLVPVGPAGLMLVACSAPRAAGSGSAPTAMLAAPRAASSGSALRAVPVGCSAPRAVRKAFLLLQDFRVVESSSSSLLLLLVLCSFSEELPASVSTRVATPDESLPSNCKPAR